MKTTAKYIILKRIGCFLPFYFFTFIPLFGQGFTLQQLKDSALRHNIAVRSARQDIEAAQEQRKEAFTKYFPNVSATGAWFNASKPTAQMDINPASLLSEDVQSAVMPMIAQSLPAEALAALSSPISISMMKNGVIAGVTALQPVFAGGKIVNGNKLAKVGEEAARLKLQLSENEVEKQTEQYFWQLAAMQEKTKTLDVADSLLSDIAKDVSVAIRAGVALKNDLLQVQLRQNETESQRLKLQNGIGIVRLLLAQYCGLSDPSFAIRYSTDGEPGITMPANGGFEYVGNLPEYQLLQKQVEATTLQKKLTMGDNLPTVAVGAGYNYHTLLDHSRSFGMIFATVSVPISDWWGGSHAIKRKKIAQKQAEEQLEDNAQLLRIRQRNAWNSVGEAQKQLDVARRGIEQATENLRLARNNYKAGISTMSNLLEAQLLYQQSLDRHTDAYAELQNRILDYNQSVGL